ncbi:MAG: hypothetical protein ACOWWM_11630 [Desulfobacterales bacterium]
MVLGSGDISRMVFKPVVRGDLGNFSLDGHSLSLLMALDGKKSLGTIAQKTGFSPEEIGSIANRLIQLKLIEQVQQQTVAAADADFFKRLTDELSLAIGPLAEVLIEDGVEDLGHSLKAFPAHRVADLVQLLAEEIQRDEKRTAFTQKMLQIIQKKGY